MTIDNATGTGIVLHAATGNRAVVSIDGLAGLPGARSGLRTLTTGHGGIDETRWLDAKVITVTGEVWGTTYDGLRAELGAIETALLQTLDTGPALLKWTWGSAGTALQSFVKLASFQAPTLAEGAKLAQYQVSFTAADPRAYSQTLTTTTGTVLATGTGGATFKATFPIRFTGSGGGGAAVTNSGEIPSPPILRIYGSCNAPSVKLVSTGQTLSFTGTIATGDYLEVDCRLRTVKLNGGTNRLNLLDAANSTWFELAPGSDTVRLSSGTFDANARCDVIYRSAYAG